MVYKILLVGSGITSAIAASHLRNKFKKNISLVVWDKARGVGGRMATSRSPFDFDCRADLGAQYITLSQECFHQHKELYESLLSMNLLEPLCCKLEGIKNMSEGTQHFVAPNGMNSLVKYFLDGVPDITCFEHHVTEVSSQGQKWKVKTETGINELFDIVILTMPIPQILQLTGTINDLIKKKESVFDNLKSVNYSSRFALVLFFDSAHGFETDWDAKYIYDDEVFRYVSLDNRKRNRPNSPVAAIFHTSIQYGLKNIDRDLKDIEKELKSHINEMFPSWPEATYVKCHRWRYSQVLTPYSGQPGFLNLAEKPLLFAGGDGFLSSHINDCISSGIALSNAIIEVIGNSV